jgi:hypothetical protein
MRDQVVRAEFHEKVLKHAHQDTNTFVLDELGLKNGEIRADIAVLNGKLVGYEIKTDKDTLSRLSSQVLAYNEVFDKVFIVTGEKHLYKSLELIPEWWGVYVIKPTSTGKIIFHCFRRAKMNKMKSSFGIAQLLWKTEVLEIVTNQLHIAAKQNTTKHDLYNVLSATYAPQKLGSIALQYLKTRQGWRINP